MQTSNNPKVTNIVQVCKNTTSSIISMNSDFISKHLGAERTAVWDLNKVKSTGKGLTEGDQTTVEIWLQGRLFVWFYVFTLLNLEGGECVCVHFLDIM